MIKNQFNCRDNKYDLTATIDGDTKNGKTIIYGIIKWKKICNIINGIDTYSMCKTIESEREKIGLIGHDRHTNYSEVGQARNG
jgi:hypothetical protein